MLTQKNNKRKNTDSFIENCIEKMGYKYDYSMVSYINNKTKVKIICSKHGIFEQTPNNHLKGQDCPECSDKHFNKKSTTEIIKEFILLNDSKYDYSMVDYKGSKVKVKIICSKHGIFEQTPNNHLKGQDCPKCKKVTTETFIDRSNKIHMNKYDYSLVEYVGMHRNVNILCKEHGIFSQKPHSHLSGVGCPKCQESKGEREIRKILEFNNLEYISQYSFKGCSFRKELRFDFYLPKLRICIEYDGVQHFKPIDFYGGLKSFKKQKHRDLIKDKYCQFNNIGLLRISYMDNIKNKIEQCLL